MLRSRFSAACLVLVYLVAVIPAAHAEFQVGTAMRIITPDPLLPVSGGIGTPTPAREKKGELTARAIVFRQGDVSVAVVQLDLLGFPSVLGNRVCAQVPRIPRTNILIGSTHTHSAPDCYAFPNLQGGHSGDLKYMDLVCNKVADAINEALDHLQAATLKIATGEAKGKIAYNYYAPDLYDRRMSVIQAVDPQGKVLATLVNYAIHPEVLGSGAGVLSPDVIGPLCDKLQEQTGGFAMFMNGAQGGMVTADNRDLDKPRDNGRAQWNDSRTWEECLRIGHLMAAEAQRIVKDAPIQKDPKVVCEALDVKFPVESPLMLAIIIGSPLKYPINPDRSVTARLNLVQLGNAQILTIPGEALPNIGFYLKRKMRGEHKLLFGLTNDAFGYILTKVDFKSFPRYDYVSRTSLGEMTGEILIENALLMIERMAERERQSRK
ncbi:MAG: Neutral/alkaline non-lysosomal ceramidase [Planctomycetaceae bacterium]|nr:Neutral/alkaline non-lysosomal ceramidase [Planctomycetaceae bacterium]